jgi:hypothetical protein
MFEWAKTGVLKKNYKTDRVNRLIAGIKLDQSELNWIYIQIVDQFSMDDIRMLKKAFGKDDEINCWELAKEILEYKKEK